MFNVLKAKEWDYVVEALVSNEQVSFRKGWLERGRNMNTQQDYDVSPSFVCLFVCLNDTLLSFEPNANSQLP